MALENFNLNILIDTSCTYFVLFWFNLVFICLVPMFHFLKFQLNYFNWCFTFYPKE